MDVRATLHWLASLAPTRLTGGPGEHAVHEAIAARLQTAGFRVDWQPFRFPPHIYGSMALHFGLACVLVVVAHWAPLAAAGGHLLVAVSFYLESARKQHLLRALWPHVSTRNLLATLPSVGPMKRRIVCLAHVDSAFTGIMFHPPVLRVVTRPPPKLLAFTYKQLRLPFFAILILIGLEVVSAFHTVPYGAAIAAVLAVPPFIAFAFNFDVLVRDRVVPGAADNLSGCAAQIVIGEAWAKAPEPGVELVLAFTGAEEAGTGGATNLARAMRKTWAPDVTEVLVLDTLSNGELFVLEEGELFARAVPPSINAAIGRGATEAGQPVPPVYPIPAGATDAFPFLIHGYRAAALTCIDREQGAPRNYHHPNDTVDRVDPTQLEASTRVAAHALTQLARA